MKKFSAILLIVCSAAFNTVLLDAACPINYVEIAGGCYLLLDNIEASFSDARAICEDFHGDLAIVDDCSVLGALTDYFAAEGVTANGIWIGATDVVSEGSWQWINGASVAMGVPFWARLLPEDHELEPNGERDENCAAMSPPIGYFYDAPCDTLRSPICQVAPEAGSCPSPYVAIRGSCFNFMSSVHVTWQEARTICQSSLGDLAVVNDCHLLADIIGKIPTAVYWIGGSDLEVEGDWKWVNGGKMRMGVPYWGRVGGTGLQPDNANGGEHCLLLWRADRYYFNDDMCSTAFSMLCQTSVV